MKLKTSKDGINFMKNGEVAAAALPHYQYGFDITSANKANLMYLRIKSIDKDGSFKYSETKTVKGLCENEWAVGVFPNPSNAVSRITVTARQGLFNGKYKITLSDISGKLMMANNKTLVNANQFNLETGNLSAGQYIINITSEDGSQAASLKWQKY